MNMVYSSLIIPGGFVYDVIFKMKWYAALLLGLNIGQYKEVKNNFPVQNEFMNVGP